jgi:hypothetical protein
MNNRRCILTQLYSCAPLSWRPDTSLEAMFDSLGSKCLFPLIAANNLCNDHQKGFCWLIYSLRYQWVVAKLFKIASSSRIGISAQPLVSPIPNVPCETPIRFSPNCPHVHRVLWAFPERMWHPGLCMETQNHMNILIAKDYRMPVPLASDVEKMVKMRIFHFVRASGVMGRLLNARTSHQLLCCISRTLTIQQGMTTYYAASSLCWSIYRDVMCPSDCSIAKGSNIWHATLLKRFASCLPVIWI